MVLRTENCPQYISHEFRSAMKLLGIKLEYIQKHTPEDNGDVESFHNSIKTDYIWPNQFMDFRDASIAIGKAFCDYNECRPHSSIDYLPPREFRDEAKQPLASLIQNSRYYHTSNQKILKIR
jgi:transposase InsO family protein